MNSSTKTMKMVLIVLAAICVAIGGASIFLTEDTQTTAPTQSQKAMF